MTSKFILATAGKIPLMVFSGDVWQYRVYPDPRVGEMGIYKNCITEDKEIAIVVILRMT